MQHTSNFINLQSLLDLSGRLNETLDEKNIYKISLLTILGKLGVIKYLIFTYRDDGDFILFDKKGIIEQGIIDKFETELNSIGKLNLDSEHFEQLRCEPFEYCLKLKYDKNIFGIILLGQKLNRNPFSDEEKQYCEIVAKILVNSIQNAKNYAHIFSEKQKLSYRNQMLKTLNEVSNSFGSKFNEKQVLQYYSLTLMGNLLINKFALFYQISEGALFSELINKFSFDINIENNIIEKIKNSNNYFEKCSQIGLDNFSNINNCYILKIYQGELLKAILILPERKTGGYDNELIDFIESLTNTLILALENARLFQSEIQRQSLENELNIALKIQQNLLPKSFPKFGEYSYFGLSLPSKQVGGDYFDIIKLPENKILIAIADVSGKGVPASLVMANLQAALHVLSNSNFKLKEAAFILNNLIYENTSFDRFVSLFFGVIDTETNKLTYINCGHNPPIVFMDSNEYIELKDGGILLGVFENFDNWKQGEIILNHSDLLLLYTDGVIEAQDLSEKEYGLKNLVSLVENCDKFQSPNNICNLIINEIQNYSQNCQQYDDITLLALKRD